MVGQVKGDESQKIYGVWWNTGIFIKVLGCMGIG